MDSCYQVLLIKIRTPDGKGIFLALPFYLYRSPSSRETAQSIFLVKSLYPLILPQSARRTQRHQKTQAWIGTLLNSAPSAISALINHWFFRLCPRNCLFARSANSFLTALLITSDQLTSGCFSTSPLIENAKNRRVATLFTSIIFIF